ncbi:AMP-binding protein [Salicibibacter kimchii]|uniref:Acyl-CoA synthetase n=1 Tax=Salicibibacter kimchii TaxID=2099786 RepID=A0A345BWP2_9BACI|nr:AMP-binding protein [Salicibibacter kimchii]AXF55373.1 acyl-CoA synthetase [Salicibibacter kimchii]
MNEENYLSELQDLRSKNWPDSLPSKPNYPFGEKPLTEYLEKWAQISPDKACIIYYGREISFDEMNDMSNRFASYLSSIGCKKGDRIAVFLPNCPQFLIAFYGILKIGCIHVPVNPMFKEYELNYELNDSGASVLITLDQLYPTAEKVVIETGVNSVITTSLSDYLPKTPTMQINKSMSNPKIEYEDAVDFEDILKNCKQDYPKPEIHLDDIAALNYTGGTTGMPKGCMHTQRNMIYTAANSATFSSKVSSEDIRLNYLPIFWIAGENTGVISPIFNGITQILLYRWDPVAVLDAIQRYKVTIFGGVTDNIIELINRPDIQDYDLSSIDTTMVSSFIKKVNIFYRDRWEKITGSILREASFGMTETHTADTFTTGMQEGNKDLYMRPIFVGFPVPNTEIKIVDFNTKESLPQETEGEIVIRTPSLMSGYWNKPEQTAETIKDNWFYTGDIGVINEEGYLHFLGRKKEMLKVNGMSVFPSELENIISKHEAVAACGVIGLDDTDKGQIPIAVIKLEKTYEDISIDELEKYCEKNMANYKKPIIKIMEEMPLTTTGKIKKDKLQEIIKSNMRSL